MKNLYKMGKIIFLTQL